VPGNKLQRRPVDRHNGEGFKRRYPRLYKHIAHLAIELEVPTKQIAAKYGLSTQTVAGIARNGFEEMDSSRYREISKRKWQSVEMRSLKVISEKLDEESTELDLMALNALAGTSHDKVQGMTGGNVLKIEHLHVGVTLEDYEARIRAAQKVVDVEPE
jgi:hypothetical protein